MAMPIQIFIAYSRKDSDLLDAFRTHLHPLERNGKAKIWYDGKIEPGARWEDSIKAHLHGADIVLLLVSSDALASDYFYDKEVADALKRHEAGTAKVIPLILRPCAWQATPLALLQALPKDGKPVTTWLDQDHALADATNSLWALVNQLEEERQEKERVATAEAAAERLDQEKAAAKHPSIEKVVEPPPSVKPKQETSFRLAPWMKVILTLAAIFIVIWGGQKIRKAYIGKETKSEQATDTRIWEVDAVDVRPYLMNCNNGSLPNRLSCTQETLEKSMTENYHKLLSEITASESPENKQEASLSLVIGINGRVDISVQGRYGKFCADLVRRAFERAPLQYWVPAQKDGNNVRSIMKINCRCSANALEFM